MLLRTALAAAAGSPARCSWLRYASLITVPSTATPMVAPTCRIAVMSAVPDPLRSAERAPMAAFIAAGIAIPSPRPVTANQATVNPVLLPVWVKVPMARPTAITRYPTVTRALTLTGGGIVEPSGPLRGLCRRLPPIMPITMPPIIGSRRRPLPSASSPRTSWKYSGIANRIPNSANEISVVRIVPQVKPAEENSDRSTSGWPRRLVTRRSQATNAASSTTPAAIVAMLVASPQPFWPAVMKP